MKGFPRSRTPVRQVLLISAAVTVTLQALGAVEPRFRAETIDSEVLVGYGLAIGDVDGDGRVDILMADKFDIVWYQNPSWEKHVMASKLKGLRDNVCIAAKDIDGDGRVEVAVGANWNPGNTTSTDESGSVHYLIPPSDRTKRWTAVTLPHEPTVHRMHWITPKGRPAELVVLPLHGRGNVNGAGENGVKIFSYQYPGDQAKDPKKWKITTLDDSLHKTHNFDPFGVELAVGGAEGLLIINGATPSKKEHWIGQPGQVIESGGIGEVRWGPYPSNHGVEDHRTFAAIEPMHGHQVVVYGPDKTRTVLDDTLKQGHAIVCGQFVPGTRQQVVAGWRNPNAEEKVGIRMYLWENDEWITKVIDDNTMACEDLKAADLNGDGKLDLIASGRTTKNLIVYWNETPAS